MVVGCVAYTANKSSPFSNIFLLMVFAEVMFKAILSGICFYTTLNWTLVSFDFLKAHKKI